MFKWRKQNHQSATNAPSDSASSQSPAVASSAVDFDALRNATATSEPEAINNLWRATFDLDRWHFINRAPIDRAPVPFVGILEEKPFVFAFTDDLRANSFGHKQKLYMPGTDAVATLSIKRSEAVRMAVSLQAQGVHGILFNDGPSGYYAPLQNLVPMISHLYSKPLAHVAQQLGVDPAQALHERLTHTGRDEHFKELMIWAMRQPTWYLFADPANPQAPLVWSSVMDESTLAVFTSLERLKSGAALLKLADATGEVSSLALAPAEAVARIASLSTSGKLQSVALNLRTPLRAEAVEELYNAISAL